MRLPDRYSSEATLLVVQQQVSQRFVEDGATTTPAAAVQAITRVILSRSRLLGIVNELGLYAKERQRLPQQQIAEKMQKDVVVEPLYDDAGRTDFLAFKISFTAGTPQLAQATTSRLTSLFIEENSRARGDQAARTAEFVTAELEEAKKKLDEQERRLQEFKMNNLSELPEQQQANLAVLTDRRMQLQNVLASLSRLQQQRLVLESAVSANLATLQSERANLLTRFTPRHSEVIKKDQEIRRLNAILERIKTDGRGVADPSIGVLPADPAIAQLASQADAMASETQGLSQDKQRLESEIATYQNRLSLTPVREQQLAAILRDYDLYKKDYTDLLGKQLQSQQSVSLEERQEGQQFRMVDPPTLPVFPSSPKRLKLSLGGLGAGIFLGFAVGFLIDMKNHSFHFEREISRGFKLPLVVAIPLLSTPAERRRRIWTGAIEAVAAGAIILAISAAEVYVYRHG
jgi:polysaccharide chain length determinant protein (PEP-CTERM system associated)